MKQTREDATLSWTDVERLFAQEAGGRDRQEIVRRLIAQAARHARQGIGPTIFLEDSRYEEALRRAVATTRREQARLAGEKQEAQRLWNLLESHPPMRRRFLIRNDRRLQTWGFYECLREHSQNLLEREPGAALEAADLALTVAQSLSPALYGEEQVHDFQAEAL